MSQFVDLGVDYFMTILIGLPDPDVIGMMIEDVLPAVQKLG